MLITYGTDLPGESQVFLDDPVRVECLGLVDGVEDPVRLPDVPLQLLLQHAVVVQVDDAYALAGGLVRVGRTDAAARRTDPFFFLPLLLPDPVDQLVIRHDEMGVVADEQPSLHVDTVRSEHLDFFHQRFGIDHGAVGNDAGLFRPENAHGNQVEDVLLVCDLYGVPGIGPALEPYDDVGLLTQKIDDLALALVAPGCAYENANGHLCFHLPRIYPDGRSSAVTETGSRVHKQKKGES